MSYEKKTIAQFISRTDVSVRGKRVENIFSKPQKRET